jgi:hypothetical protein
MADQRSAAATIHTATTQTMVLAKSTYAKGLSRRDMPGIRGRNGLVPAFCKDYRFYMSNLSGSWEPRRC